MSEVECTKFLEVDRHMEQIVKTSAFMAKIKGPDKAMIDLLEKEHKKDITNLDNAAALCFYLWFLTNDSVNLDDTNFVFQVTFNVIEQINDVLEQKPEYWILKILKLKILAYIDFDEDNLIVELESLAAAQKQNKKMPYYFVTEVLLSSIHHAKDRMEQAGALLKYVLGNYNEKVKVLASFFEGFIFEYMNMAKRSGDDDIVQMLREIHTRLF